MKNYIVKSSKGIVYLRNGITKEEEAEVRKLYANWIIKPCKPAKVKPEPHNVDEKFEITYDEVQKEDMVNYIKNFVKEEGALKDFAIASHQSKKGATKMVKKTINGKKVEVAQYFHISAKDYFFEKYFPDRWEKILELKAERKAKFSKGKSDEAKKKEAMELELLDLLNV